VQVRPEALEASLEKGLARLYLVAGAEPLLLAECCDAIRAAARARGYTERDVLEMTAKSDWAQLKDAGASPSLFASHRVLDLRLKNGKPGPAGAKALREWADAPDPDVLLLVSCDAWEKSSRDSSWARALDKAGVRVDIWPVKAAELPRWIARRMERAGLAPDREATQILAERVEGNLLAAQQEIDKLLLLRGPGPVGASDVLAAVADSSRFDSFGLAERVLQGETADALRTLAGLRRTGVAVQLVIGALTRELSIVEAYRDAVSAGENEATVFRRLNVWQARQGPLRAASRRIPAARLAEAFSRLALADRQGKGRGDGDPWQTLDRLVCALCAGPPGQ